MGTALVIEDDGFLRARSAAALGSAGYTVVDASSKDAIKVARRRPDIVVLGLSVDDPAATTVIDALAGHPLTADIPILQWSPRPIVPEDAVASLKAGATMIIGEPTSDELLVATVASMLHSRDRQRELEVALSVSGSGIFEWAIPTGEVRWSESLERVHGLDPGDFGGSFEDFVSYVHPDDVDLVSSIINEAVASGEGYSVLYRGLRQHGEPLWIEGRGRIFRDLDGHATKLVGVALDVTNRELNHERIDQLRTLASDLNADETTSDVMATVSKALSIFGYTAEVRHAGRVKDEPGLGAMRHTDDYFVFDIIPPELWSAGSTPSPDAADQVSTIGALAVSALRRGWRFDIERETAAIFQRALLPASLPEVEGWKIDAIYEPTSGVDRLGGDFYDVVRCGSQLIGFIGDVSGHGLVATSQMSSTRNLLRTLAVQGDGDPVALLSHAANLIKDLLSEDAPFITTAVVTIDIASGLLKYASAGHPPAIIRTSRGVEVLDNASGLMPPLGTGLKTGSAAAFARTLEPGETLVLYTDGVVERRGESIAASIERFADRIGSTSGQDLSARDVLNLADDDELNTDDRAILCLHRTT